MKTLKFLSLFIILILFSSCNAAKNYANYRVGGKSPKKEIIGKSIREIERNPSKSNALEMQPMHDTLELKSRESKGKVSAKSNPNGKEKFVTNNIVRNKIQNMVVGMRMETKEKTKAIMNKTLEKSETENISRRKSPMKNTSALLAHSPAKPFTATKKSGPDAEDVLYFISGILLIGAGVFALIAAGISLAETVIFGLGFIGVLILLYLLGEAFMNIFPGMSRKIRKSNWRSVKAHNSNEKEIDWEEVGEVFAGILVLLILLGLLVYLIFFSGVTFLEVLMLLLAVGLFILLFYGIWKLFEGFLFMFDN